jgi:hypothetical protein
MQPSCTFGHDHMLDHIEGAACTSGKLDPARFGVIGSGSRTSWQRIGIGR